MKDFDFTCWWFEWIADWISCQVEVLGSYEESYVTEQKYKRSMQTIAYSDLVIRLNWANCAQTVIELFKWWQILILWFKGQRSDGVTSTQTPCDCKTQLYLSDLMLRRQEPAVGMLNSVGMPVRAVARHLNVHNSGFCHWINCFRRHDTAD